MCSGKLLVCLAAIALLFSATAQADLMTGLELFSPMHNATTGTPGTVPDVIGLNDGALHGSAVVTDATRGEVLELSGTTSDYVDYGDILDPGTNDFTASIWFKWEDDGTDMEVFASDLKSNVGWIAYCYPPGALGSSTAPNGRLICYVRDASTRIALYRDFASDVKGQWQNLAMSYDNATGLIKSYINGLGSGSSGTDNGWLVWGSHVKAGLNLNNSAPLTLGKNYDGNRQPFDGRLDDFAKWGRVLSDSEVADIAADASIPEPGLFVLLAGLLAIGPWRCRR